jgi:hypothetical protein
MQEEHFSPASVLLDEIQGRSLAGIARNQVFFLAQTVPFIAAPYLLPFND